MRLVLMELDPVIVDGRRARAHAMREACAAHDVPVMPRVTDAMLSGPPESAASQVLQALGRDDEALVALLALTADRARQLGDSPAMPGAAAFVAAAALDHRVGIVTREPRRRAEAMVAHVGIADHVAFLWCGDDRAQDVVAATVEALRRHQAQYPQAHVTVLADDGPRLVAARAAGAGTVAVPQTPVEMTPDATWTSFEGRTSADLP